MADPVNHIDPKGTNIATGVAACAAAGIVISGYNALSYISAYTSLTNQYQKQLAALEKKGNCDNGDNEQQIADLTNQYQQNVLKLTGQYLTPSPGQDAALLAVCTAALLSPL